MTKFILADKQELTKLALRDLVEKAGAEEVAEVNSKKELVQQLCRLSECVVLLDYTLFDFTDVENLLITIDRFDHSQWILVSDELTDLFMRKVVFSNKRISIVFKSCSLEVIESAIASAASGQRYICQRATEQMLDSRFHAEEVCTPLTPTEIEVLRAIAQGKTTREIAAERQLSIHTINTHRKNIFRKLNVNTAHEAVKYAFRAGLVDTAEFFI
ncbi:MAG: response regulator transcription factor [Prevotella sp.]|jgi:DNA-binding NarL/FixJ family response regulator